MALRLAGISTQRHSPQVIACVHDALDPALARREAATLISMDQRLQQLDERVLP
ncbi:hypothetical protein [Synechococcus sp. CS-1332]|uniref:hypothetical protein n=1 Tax=Synechococcus sp. CS-1332 TaxID=2847972 RepID=UPI00223B964E|nr:hypothetical protein [Synechococcus sp. CS-1332]MCT0206502.1 hypothetical protein [Synechococcus sp. CS-1332]